MIAKALLKYAREFRRYMSNHAYEVSPNGVLLPKANILVQGVFVHDVNGEDERRDPNLAVDEGLVHILSVVLNNGTKNANWYIALYAANYTPVAGLTAASFPATASEITSASEGYTEATRQAWTPAAPSTPSIDNLASKAAFTIATASSLTVNGAALTSVSTKGAVTGTLFAATKFAQTRTLYDTDVYNLGYQINLTTP